MLSNTHLSLAKSILTFYPKKLFICISGIKINYHDTLAYNMALTTGRLYRLGVRNLNFCIYKWWERVKYNRASTQSQISKRKAASQDVMQEDIIHPIRQGSQAEWVKICHGSQASDFLNPLRVQTAPWGKSNYAMKKRGENMSWTGLPATRYRFLCALQGAAELPSLLFDHTRNKN